MKLFLFFFLPDSVSPIFILSSLSVVKNMAGLRDGTGANRKQIIHYQQRKMHVKYKYPKFSVISDNVVQNVVVL